MSNSTYTDKLVNKSNIKKFALEEAAKRTDASFERVSGEFYSELNDKVKELITTLVAKHAPVGKTIYGFSRQAVPVVAPTEAVPQVATPLAA